MKKLLDRLMGQAREVADRVTEEAHEARDKLQAKAQSMREQAEERVLEEATRRLIDQARDEVERRLGLHDDEGEAPGKPAGEGDRGKARRAADDPAAREREAAAREKAARERAEAERAAAERAAAAQRQEREIDDELAALRRKVGKPAKS